MYECLLKDPRKKKKNTHRSYVSSTFSFSNLFFFSYCIFLFLFLIIFSLPHHPFLCLYQNHFLYVYLLQFHLYLILLPLPFLHHLSHYFSDPFCFLFCSSSFSIDFFFYFLWQIFSYSVISSFFFSLMRKLKIIQPSNCCVVSSATGSFKQEEKSGGEDIRIKIKKETKNSGGNIQQIMNF